MRRHSTLSLRSTRPVAPSSPAASGRWALGLLASIFLPSLALANSYVFTIDSSQSSLWLSGTLDLTGTPPLGMYPMTEQGPGSLTAPVSGTLAVETDLASTIQLQRGGSIVPAITGDWRPQYGASEGTQPAQYGARFLVTEIMSGIDIAFRDDAFDLDSLALSLSGTSFDASQLLLHWAFASADARSFGPTDTAGPVSDDMLSESELPNPHPNQTSGGSLVVAGNLATLTIPIQVQLLDHILSTPGEVVLSGQIVATAVVPEPATASLLLLGMALLAGRRSARQV
jgi:hypothetical protein